MANISARAEFRHISARVKIRHVIRPLRPDYMANFSPASQTNRLRASSYEPGSRAGSVTGTNFVVCSYGKFQPGRPG